MEPSKSFPFFVFLFFWHNSKTKADSSHAQVGPEAIAATPAVTGAEPTPAGVGPARPEEKTDAAPTVAECMVKTRLWTFLVFLVAQP